MEVRTVHRDGLAEALPVLEQAVGVRVPEFLDEEACARLARSIYEGRSDWTPCFDGAQFTLGRAWYTHLEEGKTREYFADAALSDARIEARCPGLQALLRGVVASVVGADPVARRGFCGPGVHVFPASNCVSEGGGDVHADDEGLSPAQLRAHARALTLVLMLQPPERGGELRLWDGPDFIDVDYRAGELLLIDSYRLHQIRPFAGSRDRISATCHTAHTGGGWETWF